MSCHHHVEAPSSFTFYGLLWWVFMTGVAGSFSHCISMCGPIALAQLNMRLMNLTPDQIKERSRIGAAFLSPYYIGKAITYAILATIAYTISANISLAVELHYVGAILLGATGLLFTLMAFNSAGAFGAMNILPKNIQRFFSNVCSQKMVEPYGLKGMLLGMVLGLLPCGLVYGTIVVAVDSAKNIFQAASAMFIFGIATIPGLFLSSYAGATVFRKYKKWFKAFYFITMLLNAILLYYYTYKLLK